MDSMSLEVEIGSLKIYEEKIQARKARREEQLLLSKAWGNQRNMKKVLLVEEVVAMDFWRDFLRTFQDLFFYFILI